jgi:hypothetical protein
LITVRREKVEELRAAHQETVDAIGQVDKLTAHLMEVEAELKAKTEAAIGDASVKYENLLETLASHLLPSSSVVNEAVVIEAVRRLMVFATTVSNSPTKSRTADLGVVVREWQKWGRDLVGRVSDGVFGAKGDSDVRFILGELVLSSIAQRKLVDKLESLRTQKKIWQSGVALSSARASGISTEGSSERQAMSFSEVLGTVVGIVRILKKGGIYPLTPVPSFVTPDETFSDE